MKFAEMDLTIAEARAFRRWLGTLITDEDRELLAHQSAEQAAESERQNRIYIRLCETAAETAQFDGCTSIPPHLQAAAAWEAFVACTGYLSRYDVDEHWEPDDEDADAWQMAYIAALPRKRSRE